MSKDAGPQPSLEHLAWDAIWTLLPHMDPPEVGHTLRANKLLKELCDSSVCWEALHCSNTWVTPRPCDLPPKSALVKRWASEVRLRESAAIHERVVQLRMERKAMLAACSASWDCGIRRRKKVVFAIWGCLLAFLIVLFFHSDMASARGELQHLVVLWAYALAVLSGCVVLSFVLCHLARSTLKVACAILEAVLRMETGQGVGLGVRVLAWPLGILTAGMRLCGIQDSKVQERVAVLSSCRGTVSRDRCWRWRPWRAWTYFAFFNATLALLLAAVLLLLQTASSIVVALLGAAVGIVVGVSTLVISLACAALLCVLWTWVRRAEVLRDNQLAAQAQEVDAQVGALLERASQLAAGEPQPAR